MFLIMLIVKFLIIILIFRYVATPQELAFNPVGKTVALLTDYLFKNFRKAKEQTDKYIPFMIVGLILFALFIQIISTRVYVINAVVGRISEFTSFFMQFLTISVLLSYAVKKPIISYYFVYFYRIATPLMRFTRKFIKIDSAWIILLTIVVIFITYIFITSSVFLIFNLIEVKRAGTDMMLLSDISDSILKSIHIGLLSLIDLIRYMIWIIVLRTIMSWVSPNPNAPLVQVIYALSEPLLAPLKAIIPPIGMFDLSPLIALFILWFSSNILTAGVLYIF